MSGACAGLISCTLTGCRAIARGGKQTGQGKGGQDERVLAVVPAARTALADACSVGYSFAVPRLVHLNGPPGIGKSTIAALYVERHPGTLNLDIDSLHRLVGGWHDLENDTHELLRPVALAMATTHLRGGRDVVLPQYLARLVEIDAFENVAREQGAKFGEFVLLGSKRESIERFDRRARDDDDPWVQHNHRLVEQRGGQVLLESMWDELFEVVRRRPSAVVIQCELGAIEKTYELVIAAIAADAR